MDNNYQCATCKRKFSRKWNALRHNDKIHNGTGIIINNLTGPVFTTGRNIDSESSTQGFFTPNNDHEDEKITEFYGKLIKPFEELEKVLIRTPETQRDKFLAEIIVIALMSSNPVKSLYEALEFNLAIHGRIKIINYVSRYRNEDPVRTEFYLTQMIKNNRYFKNNIQFKRKGI